MNATRHTLWASLFILLLSCFLVVKEYFMVSSMPVLGNFTPDAISKIMPDPAFPTNIIVVEDNDM